MAEEVDLPLKRQKRLEPQAEAADLCFALAGRVGAQKRDDPVLTQRGAGVRDVQMRIGDTNEMRPPAPPPFAASRMASAAF